LSIDWGKSMTVDVRQTSRIFKLILGVSPGAADLEIIAALGGTVDAVADYIWDHHLGEPDVPSSFQVQRAVQVIVSNKDLSDEEVIELASEQVAALAD
jgi:hypothetical protein